MLKIARRQYRITAAISKEYVRMVGRMAHLLGNVEKQT
jgi:hypothetical protein